MRALVDEGEQAHLAEHVLRVVGCHAVRAQADVHATSHQLGHRRKSVAQLHVGGGVGGDAHVVFREYLDVGLVYADAVGCDGRTVKEPRFGHIFNGRAVVVAPHVVALHLALGDVDVDTQAALAGDVGDHAQVVLAAAVGGVRVETEGQAVAVGTVAHLLECLGQTVVGSVVGIAYEASTDHGAHAALAHRTRGLVDVHLLVVEAGRARADHLRLAEQRRPVAVLRFQAVLYGLHRVEEPVGEAQVVGCVAHHGHVGVGVRVDEAGNRQAAGAVDGGLGDEARRRGVERRDRLAVDVDVVPLDSVGAVFGHDCQNIFDKDPHRRSRRRCTSYPLHKGHVYHCLTNVTRVQILKTQLRRSC